MSGKALHFAQPLGMVQVLLRLVFDDGVAMNSHAY